jgi:xanthine dehydrogenase YagR molybdenum-binding subunit
MAIAAAPPPKANMGEPVPRVDARLKVTGEARYPAGIKGLGELANVGTAAAIANAVYHATGKRVHKLPIRIESLLSA